MVGTGDVKATLLEHTGERCHRGAANSNQMDVLPLHECDTRTDAGSGCTAASEIQDDVLPDTERGAYAEG